MTKRHITPHKGGRTARAPEARMTPQERGRLDMVLQHRGVKHIDWYIGHIEADYAEITGDDTMKHPTDMEIATNYALWQEYADPHSTMTEQEFDAMSIDEKIDMLKEMFPNG